MIRVLLADDEHLVRTALAQMLDLEEDLEVVAEAADGAEAIEAAGTHAPDVAVLDLQMPRGGGIEVAKVLAREVPGCACLIVTSHGRPGYLKRALEAGVAAFLRRRRRRPHSPRSSAPSMQVVGTSTRGWPPRPWRRGTLP